MIQQKRKNARWLLLKAGQRTVLTKLERFVVELKLSKANDGMAEHERCRKVVNQFPRFGAAECVV